MEMTNAEIENHIRKLVEKKRSESVKRAIRGQKKLKGLKIDEVEKNNVDANWKQYL